VNYVNVDNLFYNGVYKTKLSYTDYCCVTEDFATENIDEEALRVCENFGYPRQFVIKCLNRGDINHATACYFLLTNSLWLNIKNLKNFSFSHLSLTILNTSMQLQFLHSKFYLIFLATSDGFLSTSAQIYLKFYGYQVQSIPLNYFHCQK
jgi:hypothetical protein